MPSSSSKETADKRQGFARRKADRRLAVLLAAATLLLLFAYGYIYNDYLELNRLLIRNQRQLSDAEGELRDYKYKTGGTLESPEAFKAELRKKEISRESVPDFNIHSLIRIGSEEDAQKKRRALTRLIFGADSLDPNRLPDRVERIPLDQYHLLPPGTRVRRLTVSMRHGVDSAVYQYRPRQRAGCLMIFHRGHQSDRHYPAQKHVVEHFVTQGCDVLAFSMPLTGWNNRPVADIPGFGRVTLSHHDYLALLQTDRFNPLAYFLEPVAAALNFSMAGGSYKRIGMTGLSGGGWVTTLYAALDERIQASYPVAGSHPIFLRSLNRKARGDYEQLNPALYRTANYLELYLLGAVSGRRQLQVLNRYDNDSYSGTAHRSYAPILAKAAESLGGSFSIHLDESSIRHVYSKIALLRVSKDFFGHTPPRP